MPGAKAPPLIPTNCFVLRTPKLLPNIRLSRNFHHRSIPIPCTKKAATHATRHCQSTTAMAHFPPSSLRTEAMAATQGVYSRLNTSNVAALPRYLPRWQPRRYWYSVCCILPAWQPSLLYAENWVENGPLPWYSGSVLWHGWQPSWYIVSAC